MPEKVLLTNIPTPFDTQNHLDNLIDMKLKNEEENFQREVAFLLDLCIRAIIEQTPKQPDTIKVSYTTSNKVGFAVKNRLAQQGWQVEWSTVYVDHHDRSRIVIYPNAKTKELKIPSPAEFKEGMEITLWPVPVFSGGLATFVNGCLSALMDKKRHTGNEIYVDTDTYSSAYVAEVTNLFEKQGWKCHHKPRTEVDLSLGRHAYGLSKPSFRLILPNED